MREGKIPESKDELIDLQIQVGIEMHRLNPNFTISIRARKALLMSIEDDWENNVYTNTVRIVSFLAGYRYGIEDSARVIDILDGLK